MMQSRSSVPEGPRHWIKIKPLSPSILHWGHWEEKDVINQVINLTPEASTFGFLPCTSSVLQGRGWHPAAPRVCARRVLTRQHRSREMLSAAATPWAPVGEVCHIITPWRVSSSFAVASTCAQLLLERFPLGAQGPESKTSRLIPFLLAVSRSVPGTQCQGFDALHGPHLDHVCQDGVLVGNSPGVHGLQHRSSLSFFPASADMLPGLQPALTVLFMDLLCSISSWKLSRPPSRIPMSAVP